MAERTCSVDGCVRATRARGLCNTHYHMRRRGKPLAPFEGMGTPDPRCSFDGCSGAAIKRGLCGGHGRQRYLGRELRPLRTTRARGECLERNTAGEKQCFECLGWKPESGFQKNRATADGLETRCRTCNRERLAVWNSDPDVQLRSRLRAHGMTIDRFKQMLAAQGGGCAICGTGLGGGQKRRLSIDHDHACCPGRESCGKCVRGLLCSPCNSGIGYLRDDPTRLRAAVKYLESSTTT